MHDQSILPNLPNHSRVWIYTSNREFTDFEISEIERLGADFAESWRVHGSAVAAELKVLYRRFIIIAADEQVAPVSGCGIDSSVAFIKGLEERFVVSLLDKLNLGYIDSEGNVRVVRMMEFYRLLETGEITEQTTVFNNLVETLGQLHTDWQVPLANSWHAQMLS